MNYRKIYFTQPDEKLDRVIIIYLNIYNHQTKVSYTMNRTLKNTYCILMYI